jgi:hypothetical protein
MLRASRLSEMHALEVQTLPAEPAGGGVAAGPPAPGPPPQPETQDAASATTPSATTQIRLTTADLPAPPRLDRAAKPVPSGARQVPFHQTLAEPSLGKGHS